MHISETAKDYITDKKYNFLLVIEFLRSCRRLSQETPLKISRQGNSLYICVGTKKHNVNLVYDKKLCDLLKVSDSVEILKNFIEKHAKSIKTLDLHYFLPDLSK